MLNRFFLLLFLLFFGVLFGQQEKLIKGKINTKNSKLSGVRVVNLSNEREVFTDQQGEFSILGKPNDLLIFSAEFLDYMRKIIDESDYRKGNFEIEMTSKIVQLDEVEIRDYSRINAVDLGILSKPAKQYTPAERRLKTASGTDISLSAGTMAGIAVGLDPLMNWISGRTAMLKSSLEFEKKEILLKKIKEYYEEQFFIEKLKIESLYLGAFLNYTIYDSIFVAAVNSDNKARMDFNLYRLAAEFNKINDYEK